MLEILNISKIGQKSKKKGVMNGAPKID